MIEGRQYRRKISLKKIHICYVDVKNNEKTCTSFCSKLIKIKCTNKFCEIKVQTLFLRLSVGDGRTGEPSKFVKQLRC